MADSEFNAVDFGKMIATVEQNTMALGTLTEKVTELEKQLNTGRGMLLGITLAAGGVGGTFGALAHRWIG